MKNIKANDTIALSYLFTNKVLNNIIHKDFTKLMKIFVEFNINNIFKQNITFRELFENSYKQLLKYYKNEYIFKNAIAQKILLGRHSIKSSVLFTEFRVETSKADIVIFNGTSHVYEIKTELDTLERLQKQIKDYQKVFEYVNIVTVESKVKAIKEMIDDRVGIIVLTDRYTLKTIKKAKSCLDMMDKNSIFNLFRKQEYLKVIKDYQGSVPDVPNTKIHSVCQEIFNQFSIKEANKVLVRTLKQRKNYNDLVTNIKKFPNSLKLAILELGLNQKEQKDFLELLDTKVNSISTQRATNVLSIS